MKKFLLCLIFIFCSFKHLSGKAYVEINTISNLNKYCENKPEKTLVIFRLDNTLIRLEQMLGSIEWVQSRKIQLQKLPAKKALQQVLLEWLTIQNLTKCKLVDEEIVVQLKTIQELGYNVLIITERPFYLIRSTQSQLENLNISLESSPYTNTTLLLNDHILSQQNEDQEILPIVLQNGILFTSGIINNNSFSYALDLLFQRRALRPQNVIYVDQDKDHIRELQSFCEEKKVSFTGLRLSVADKEILNFNNKIAEIQLNYLLSFFSPQILDALTQTTPTKTFRNTNP